MQVNLSQLSQQARIAVQRRDWTTVNMFARKIQKLGKKDPEGYFLAGLVDKAAGRIPKSITAFSRALSLDSRRYDVAIELANQYLLLLRHGEAYELLCKYEQYLDNSPLYLDMAAKVFSGLGLHERAWLLFEKANQLQPEIDMFRVNLAASSVLLGKLKQAKAIYQELIGKYPQHQKNHYELSKLGKAKDSQHVEQMQNILESTNLSPEKNIFLYYAIGKELEDLGRWQESFYYYKCGGDAILTVADYDVADDIKLIDQIIRICNTDWLLKSGVPKNSKQNLKTPIFIVGLPRTGTTLVERIISSHSQVESADETFYMQMAIRHASGVGGINDVDAAIIKKAAEKDIRHIAKKYMQSVDYRLTDQVMFIDKYPNNFLYLGFIAKAFPDAHIIYLRRNPMDACFAMYKQSFFKFAYDLDDLGRYYVAHNNLLQHWQDVLGDRLIEVDYEAIVTDQENQTREILDQLELEFEQACLDFEQNSSASATASTVQVRQKVHTQSVNKWKNYSNELQSLKKFLDGAGINTNQEF